MLWVLAIACAVEDGPFGGGGEEGTPTGGGQAGDGGGGDGLGGTDDTGSGGCTDRDLQWSVEAANASDSKPFYSGDAFTFWGYVQNPCANAVAIAVESTCLFDIVTLRPPNGAAEQQALVPGCTSTTKTLEIGAYDIELQSYGWGPLYVAGVYGFSMQATTPDERVLSGTFTLL
jgi:hypothetical protein